MLFKHLTYLIIIPATNDFPDGHSNEFEEQFLNPNYEIGEITSPKASSFFEIETTVECFDK